MVLNPDYSHSSLLSRWTPHQEGQDKPGSLVPDSPLKAQLVKQNVSLWKRQTTVSLPSTQFRELAREERDSPREQKALEERDCPKEQKKTLPLGL